MMKSRFLLGLILLKALLLAGCTMLPADGPSSMDVQTGQHETDGLPFALIKIAPSTIEILSRVLPRLTSDFVDRRPPRQIVLGVGDAVRVSIFEAGSGGLFIPSEASVRPGNFIDLPTQAIDNKGNITVPYAPPIPAAGRTPQDVQRSIVQALKNRAIDPQAVVSVAEQRTSLISILGDVKMPGRFPANASGEKLLESIARAQGPLSQGFDEWVMLEREGKRSTVPFGALVYEPSNNIWVHPNDTIFLYKEPQTFTIFGASGRQAGTISGSGATGQIPFDSWRLSLAEAIAKAGGLSDDRADPSAVFLYRGETRNVAEDLGIDVRRIIGPIVPVVYHLDLRDPSGYFLASKFAMRNKDVIYIANAGSVESTKAMIYFRTIIGTMNDPIIAATNALVFKNIIATTSQSTAIAVGGSFR
jgi:polysaccharide export outer membrane protein